MSASLWMTLWRLLRITSVSWERSPTSASHITATRAFFKAAGFVEEAEQGDISIGVLTVPGAGLTIEIMEYHAPQGRKEPVIFGENDVSGARHVALKVSNIEEAFDYIKAQPDTRFINETAAYQVYQISRTEPNDFYYFDPQREADALGKRVAADILGQIKYFYFQCAR